MAGKRTSDYVELTLEQIAALQAAYDELLAWWQPHKDMYAEAQAWWQRHEEVAPQMAEMGERVPRLAEMVEYTVRAWLREFDPQGVASKLKREWERERERERRRQREQRREAERAQDHGQSEDQRSQQRQSPPQHPQWTLPTAPYEVLHVAHDAPLAVAEAAYRALSKAAHPDAGGTHEHMSRLNAAIKAFRATRSIAS